jgi:hypothetical protein
VPSALGEHLIDTIDLAEFLQKLRVTIIEANDFPELGAVAPFALYHFAQIFTLPNTVTPCRQNTNIVPWTGSHHDMNISLEFAHLRRLVVREPDVVLHEHTVEEVIAYPPSTRLNHSPRSIGDDFSNTNAIVVETHRSPVFTCAHQLPNLVLENGIRQLGGLRSRRLKRSAIFGGCCSWTKWPYTSRRRLPMLVLTARSASLAKILQ